MFRKHKNIIGMIVFSLLLIVFVIFSIITWSLKLKWMTAICIILANIAFIGQIFSIIKQAKQSA